MVAVSGQAPIPTLSQILPGHFYQHYQMTNKAQSQKWTKPRRDTYIHRNVYKGTYNVHICEHQ